MAHEHRGNAAPAVLLRVLVERAQKFIAHLFAEAVSKCARICEQSEREEDGSHAREPPFAEATEGKPFSSRRVRAAASCPSSRPTSARATATPRDVSR